MTIAIYGSRRQQAAIEYISQFLDVVACRHDRLVMHGKLYRHLMELIPEAMGTVDVLSTETSDFTADLAISLGGDGTFLRNAVWIADKQIPIVGVNTGHLGYLTALTVDRLPEVFDLIASDYLRVERRTMLQVVTPALPPAVGQYALNEVSLIKLDSASMIVADVAMGDRPLARYRADGLIVCTATGSTAYNLSVGGPLVDPTLDVVVISPVAAHALAMRPLVAGGDSDITIVPGGRAAHLRLALDGRSEAIDTDTPIVIRRAPFKVLVMQVADHTFADCLRDKLHWGEV